MFNVLEMPRVKCLSRALLRYQPDRVFSFFFMHLSLCWFCMNSNVAALHLQFSNSAIFVYKIHTSGKV